MDAFKDSFSNLYYVSSTNSNVNSLLYFLFVEYFGIILEVLNFFYGGKGVGFPNLREEFNPPTSV